MSLDQASAALIGAAIGAIAGLLGALVTSWRQSKLERERWLRAREDAVRTDTAEALRHLAKTLASAAHSMLWATYKAIKYGRVGQAELGAYEQEYHEAVADMVSSQMHLAALDRSLSDQVKSLIDETIYVWRRYLRRLEVSLGGF